MQVLTGACLKQGLIKQEGKQRYGEQFAMWQKRASEFEIDGQAPVRSIAAVHPRLLYVTALLKFFCLSWSAIRPPVPCGWAQGKPLPTCEG